MVALPPRRPQSPTATSHLDALAAPRWTPPRDPQGCIWLPQTRAQNLLQLAAHRRGEGLPEGRSPRHYRDLRAWADYMGEEGLCRHAHAHQLAAEMRATPTLTGLLQLADLWSDAGEPRRAFATATAAHNLLSGSQDLAQLQRHHADAHRAVPRCAWRLLQHASSAHLSRRSRQQKAARTTHDGWLVAQCLAAYDCADRGDFATAVSLAGSAAAAAPEFFEPRALVLRLASVWGYTTRFNAARAIAQAQALRPEEVACLLDLARGAFNAGDFRLANAYLHRLIERDPEGADAEVALRAGVLQVQLDDKLTLCAAEARTTTAQLPVTAPTAPLRALLHECRGEYAAAVAELTRELDEDDQIAELHARRARLLAKLNHTAAACHGWNVALNLQPKRADFHEGRGQFYLALQQYDLARRDAERALVLAPSRPKAMELKVRALLQGSQVEAAQQTVEALIAAYPTYFFLRILCGQVLNCRHDLLGAKKQFLRAWHLQPTSYEALLNVVLVSVHLEEAGAEQLLAQVTRTLPHNRPFWMQLALLYHRRGLARWASGDLLRAAAIYERFQLWPQMSHVLQQAHLQDPDDADLEQRMYQVTALAHQAAAEAAA